MVSFHEEAKTYQHWRKLAHLNLKMCENENHLK